MQVLQRVTLTTAQTSVPLRPHHATILKLTKALTIAVITINTAAIVFSIFSARKAGKSYDRSI